MAFTAMLSASLTPSVLLLLVLFVPLLSLMSLLLVIGVEGTYVFKTAHMFAVVANCVCAVVFCHGHAAPRPTIPVGELELARLTPQIGDILRQMSAIPRSVFSRWDVRKLSYSGG